MPDAVVHSLGGLGLFLFGMHTLTDGLRKLAGDSLRRVLRRFTRSPLTGAMTGAVTTAVVQSSSAVTVAAIGFVGAGILTFGQTLGILFGANVGTTATGWLVGLLGFKFALAPVLLPTLFVGSLLVLFGRGRTRAIGRAICGFALAFIGLDFLKEGLSAFDVTPDSFPGDTIGGRALLVLIGFFITLVTQSSSAGVAAAMAAVLAGSMDLPQAAAMVIGMDVGTTITGVIASLGGTLAARRTAIAHVVYNLGSAVMAFAILPLYFTAWRALGQPGAAQPQLVIVAFHTTFNGLGTLLVLPFTDRFAAFIERLVPDRRESLTSALRPALCADPGTALDAFAVSADGVAAELREATRAVLQNRPEPDLADVRAAIPALRAYLLDIEGSDATQERHVAAAHLVDHLDRLLARIHAARRLPCLWQPGRVADWARPLASAPADAGALHDVWRRLEDDRADQRRALMTVGTDRDHTVDEKLLDERLDALRWLRRTAYHLWQVEHRLAMTRA